MHKSFSTNCSACGKSAEAHVSQEDFQYQDRFTDEWKWSDDATVQAHCHHTKNPIHQQNSGTLTVSWNEFENA